MRGRTSVVVATGRRARRSATPNGAPERSWAQPVCASPRRGAPRAVVTATRSPGRTVPIHTVAPPRCSSGPPRPNGRRGHGSHDQVDRRLHPLSRLGGRADLDLEAGHRAGRRPRSPRSGRRAAAPRARTAIPPARSCRSGRALRPRAVSPVARLRTRIGSAASAPRAAARRPSRAGARSSRGRRSGRRGPSPDGGRAPRTASAFTSSGSAWSRASRDRARLRARARAPPTSGATRRARRRAPTASPSPARPRTG